MVRIYGHSFAAFYWKVLIALYERDVPFEFLVIDADHPENAEAVSRLAPTGQFPVLVDGDRTWLAYTLRSCGRQRRSTPLSRRTVKRPGSY